MSDAVTPLREAHIERPSAQWVTFWVVQVKLSPGWSEVREDRYALVWSRPQCSEPRVVHVAVERDGNWWRATSPSWDWKSEWVATKADAQDKAERWMGEMTG